MASLRGRLAPGQKQVYVRGRSDEGWPMTSTLDGNPTPQPSADMLRMLNAFLTVQALHVAAVLGVADLLAAGSKTLDELAAATKADRSSLHRLLRMLTGPGVFREEVDGRFAITPLGATLRSDG